MSIISEKLIKKSSHDLKIAIDELKTAEPVYDMICFHFQQCIEKLLKAFLCVHEIEYKRTHNLLYLFNECSRIDNEFDKYLETDLIDLNNCGVDIRYDDLDDVEKEFIESVHPIVLEFYRFVNNKLTNTLFKQ